MSVKSYAPPRKSNTQSIFIGVFMALLCMFLYAMTMQPQQHPQSIKRWQRVAKPFHTNANPKIREQTESLIRLGFVVSMSKVSNNQLEVEASFPMYEALSVRFTPQGLSLMRYLSAQLAQTDNINLYLQIPYTADEDLSNLQISAAYEALRAGHVQKLALRVVSGSSEKISVKLAGYHDV